MNAVLLIDIGSTFTKVSSVDISSVTLLGRAQAPTTISSDVQIGLKEAMHNLEKETGIIDYQSKLACSSAAGGLSIAVSGLVESLTLKAAKLAALGAGAKIIRGFHHIMTKSDISYLENNHFDIFLLTGGTDGGNTGNIIENAKLLAGITKEFPVVIAGNRNASDEVAQILKKAGKDVFLCPNILPDLENMNTEPVNKIIRQLFMDRIVHAKGISRVDEMTDNDMIPTPYAVLLASQLLADGYDNCDGLGCLMTVDAGGATTDVHSICDGYGVRDDVLYEGLREPRTMRTVEGDIGVRWNLNSILSMLESRGKEFDVFIEKAVQNPSVVFGEEGIEFETAIASKALETAVKRHCGTITQHFTPRGARYVQKGKDLTGVNALIATGGPVSQSETPLKMLKKALYNPMDPDSLRPKNPDIYIDSRYIMASAGLLSTINKEKACFFMKKYLKKIEAGAIYD